jgi:hypothetical protein
VKGLARASQTQTWLNNNITSYDAQITNLQKIVSLQDTVLLYNGSVIVPSSVAHLVWHNLLAVPPSLWFNLEAPPAPIEYAGYVIVNIVSSTSNSTSVQVDYSSGQLSYDSTASTGSSGFGIFPYSSNNHVGHQLA